MLQGVTSFHDEHTPTCALPQSSSVMPMARSIARAGARSAPSVTSRLRILTSTVDSLAGLADRGSDMGNQRTPGRTGASHPFRPFRPGLTGGSVPPASTTSRLHSPFDREIARLAIPALGALVAEPIYVLTDTAIVGHLGTPQLGGMAVATTLLLTRLHGVHLPRVRDDRGGAPACSARRPARGRAPGGAVAVARASAVGVVLLVLGLLGADLLVSLMGAEGAVRTHALVYLRVSLLGMPALLVVLAGTGYLRGMQDTRTPLAVAVGTGALNLVLEVVFIYGLGRGLGASAATTVVAQYVGAAVYVWRIGRAVRAHHVDLRPDPASLRRLGTVGADLLVRTAALRASLLVATAVAARLGPVDVAAHQIAFEIWSLLALGLDAIAIAGQAIVGRALGADDASAARGAGRRMIEWGVAGGIATGPSCSRCTTCCPACSPTTRPSPTSPRSSWSGWRSCSR